MHRLMLALLMGLANIACGGEGFIEPDVSPLPEVDASLPDPWEPDAEPGQPGEDLEVDEDPPEELPQTEVPDAPHCEDEGDPLQQETTQLECAWEPSFNWAFYSVQKNSAGKPSSRRARSSRRR